MDIINFNYDGSTVTTIKDKDNNIWFSAKDTCKILDIKNVSDAVSRHCSKKGIVKNDNLSNGGKQSSLFINESNLYRLVFRSKKKESILFQDWIFEQVIPQIRKTGEYHIPKNLKKLSTEKRKELTHAWSECGITKKHHFINLTLQEYKTLGFEKGKKKKDFSKGELLLLSALESMEMLMLHNNPKDGYYECKDSIIDTAQTINKSIENKTKELK